MPINYQLLSQLQPINPPRVIATASPAPAPSGGGDDGGIGGLFSGLSSLMGGLGGGGGGMGGGGGSAPAPTPSAPPPVVQSAPPVGPGPSAASGPISQGGPGPIINSGSPNLPKMASVASTNPLSRTSLPIGIMPGMKGPMGSPGPIGSIMSGAGISPGPKPQQGPQGDLFSRPAFQTALQAQKTAQENGLTKSNIMTVVDYSIPSNQKRMWVVDSANKQVLMNTYVAHGSGSGRGLVPQSFSNKEGSHQSSLGTFLTGDTYQGKHGESLRIKGLDKGVNDQAFNRAIVVHGGNYVGPDKSGTSWGCFTVPQTDVKQLIGLTKSGSIIHAYAPQGEALNHFNNSLTEPAKTNFSSAMSNSVTQVNGAHPELQSTMRGIAGVESQNAPNPYTLMGKTTRTGDRAYGKYQIMGSNVGPWTKEATGKSYTPQEFMANPDIQERTAAFMINKNLQAGYSPQNAASIWFSGRPMNKAGNARDAYGTSVPQYVKKFNEFYNQAKTPTPINAPTQNAPQNSPIGQQLKNTFNTTSVQPRNQSVPSSLSGLNQLVAVRPGANIRPYTPGESMQGHTSPLMRRWYDANPWLPGPLSPTNMPGPYRPIS